MAAAPEIKASPEQIVDQLAHHLIDTTPSLRPLAIVENSYDARLLRRRISTLGCFGLRVLTSQALLQAYPPADPAVLPVLAQLDEHASLRTVVDGAILHTNIYLDLLRNSSFRNPLNLAGIFSATLQEMSVHLDDTASCNPQSIAQHSNYKEECTWLIALWDKYCRTAVGDRNQRLADCAAGSTAPLAYLGWEQPQPHIQRMLDAAAPVRPVLHGQPQLNDNAAALYDLWCADRDTTTAYTGPVPQLCPGYNEPLSLESAAEHAFALLQQWLSEGKRNIGIIAYDRLLVRRLHSMCLQHGIHLGDLAGWLASNMIIGDILLAGATVSDRAPNASQRSLRSTLDALQHTQLLRTRLLMPASRHLSEQKKPNWVEKVSELCDQSTPLENVRRELETVFAQLKHRTPAQWFADLAECTQQQPLQSLFANDPAGSSIKTLLNLLCHAIDSNRFSQPDQAIGAGEIATLLRNIFTNLRLVVSDVNSDIHLLSPNALSTEKYDALLLLGADANTLPALPVQQLFGEQVRQEIGLPGKKERLHHQRTVTALRLANHDVCAAVWRGSSGISPYLDLAIPRDRTSYLLPAIQPSWATQPVNDLPCQHNVALKELPAGISPSSCDTLMACPYKFYVRHVLGIRTSQTTHLFDPSAFGSFVHDILNKFHTQLLELNDQLLSQQKLIAMLANCTTDHLNSCRSKGESMGKLSLLNWRWQPFIAQYVKQLVEQQEKTGFKLLASEKKCDKKFSHGTHTITLYGKIDRIDCKVDEHGKKQFAVIDVKTGRVKPNDNGSERPQLALYVDALGALQQNSSYWQLDGAYGHHQIKVVGLDDNFTAEEIRQNLLNIFFTDMASHQPLPANAIDAVCRFCDYEGMCRRSHLQQASASSS